MKIPLPSKKLPGGYISVMAVSGLATILLLILLAAYRSSVQTQEVQRRAQIRIDYNQREQAILRSVLNIAPNRAMIGMMGTSGQDTSYRNVCRWRWVFEHAVNQANAEEALSDNTYDILGVPSGAISGNSGDGSQGHVRNVVTPIGSRRYGDFLITAGINGIENSLGDGFPESLQSVHAQVSDEDDAVYITTEKQYDSGELFKVLPYPDIHFGYTDQDQTFVAKRNWWGFTLGFGYNSEDDTLVHFRSKDYVLSIYEVPSQLALGSNTTTYLGKFSDGTDWSNISVEGSVFGDKLLTEGDSVFDRVSSRKGVEMGLGTTVGGVTPGVFGETTQSREEFEAANASFYPLSSSSDSGLVAFIPIDMGDAAFDDLTDTTDDNRLSPTSWNEYSRPAMQTVMKLRVEDVVSSSDQTPTQISFTYKVGGVDTTVQFTKGVNWPNSTSTEGQLFPFHVDSTDAGRKGIAVYIGRMTEYLTSVGADDLDVNSSLMIGANYLDNVNIQKPNIPSLASDTILILRDTNDLTMFPEGFSLVTPYRLYIVNDVNLVPSGVDLSGNSIYPPVSIFAPEKRFGIKNNAVEILFDGQLNYLGGNSSGSVRPLDLVSGENEEIVPENIRANLFSISDPSELPPITQMNWLVTIEEVRP
jgi:hypothetical protein